MPQLRDLEEFQRLLLVRVDKDAAAKLRPLLQKFTLAELYEETVLAVRGFAQDGNPQPPRELREKTSETPLGPASATSQTPRESCQLIPTPESSESTPRDVRAAPPLLQPSAIQ